MAESLDFITVRDLILRDLIVFGSLSVSLVARPEAITPRLPFSVPDAILEDGEPNLMSALRWEYGLSPTLRGRDTDLSKLLDWAEGGGNIVSARLITGPGGAGKTRLAAEAARELRRRGWIAGFLERDAQVGRVIDVSGRREGGGLLLIVDYPEERLDVIEGLLKHVADIASPPLPIRFLLLSRRSFEDWRRQTDLLGGRFGSHELVAPGPLDMEEARALIVETAEAFAAVTGAPTPPLEDVGPWLEADPRRALPLFAMAAGLHAVLTGLGNFDLGAPELMREIARREHQRVRRVSGAIGLGEFGLERLLGVALVNAIGLGAERIIALGALDITPGIAGQALLDALATTPWWRPSELGGRRLARLEPDRPAAAFLELALLADPQPLLPEWLFAATAGARLAFGQVLSRLAWDLSELSGEGSGAGALERAAIAMIDAEPKRAPLFGVAHWGAATPFSAGFGVRVLTEELEEEGDPVVRMAMLNDLSKMLSHLGRLEEAVAAADEQAVYAGHLAMALPADHTLALAAALNNLSNFLADVGRREEALSAAERAVSLLRPITSARPWLLASALNDLALRRAALGLRDEAVTAARQAVAEFCSLENEHPGEFSSDLATALTNLSNRLIEIGRSLGAVAASRKAVVLNRRLVGMAPDVFAPGLAASLVNSTRALAARRRDRAALAAAKEAVELYRMLTRTRADAFTTNLVKALGNLAACLSREGQHQTAVNSAEEAVRRLSPHFLANPAAHASLMQTVGPAYVQTCRAAGLSPSADLLAPIAEALKRLESGTQG